MYHLIIASLCIFVFSCTSSQTSNSTKTPNKKVKGTIEIDQSKLAYVVEGEGVPTLVIGSSIYYPRTFSPDLRKHLKLYFVDLKWFAKGLAAEDSISMNIESIVEDVEQIRVALQLENPLIMGHSIHGTIATEYVKRYQDKVRGLVVIGSPAEWANDTYQQKAAALWETASKERKKLQYENWGQLSEIDRLTGKEEAAARYNNTSPQYWYEPTYDASWLWDDMTVHTGLTEQLFTEVFAGYNMFDPAIDIYKPTLVIMGAYDYVIPHTLWKKNYKSMKDFKFLLFNKSGHTPQLEQAAKFDSTVIAWMAQKKL